MLSVHDQKLLYPARILFILYLLILVYILFLLDIRDSTYHNVNLEPFKTLRMFSKYYFKYHYFSFQVWFSNIFGNILLLAPFGFLLPILSGHHLSIPKILLLAFWFSFSIELLQYVTGVGEADIDDLILNVFGAALGYCFYRLWHYIEKRKEGIPES